MCWTTVRRLVIGLTSHVQHETRDSRVTRDTTFIGAPRGSHPRNSIFKLFGGDQQHSINTIYAYQTYIKKLSQKHILESVQRRWHQLTTKG